MGWAQGFIAVDWGTTNRRAYRVDSARQCTAEFEDGQGILAVAPGGFPAAVAEIRERLGDHPLLMAGMVGSNRGWVEAPYAPCPAGLGDLVHGLAWAEDGRAAIVPGVSYQAVGRADVMRGEEVQILGAAAAGAIPPDCLVCHPGTHNKWIRLVGGRIAEFRTVMTGEMFNLLKANSILSDLLTDEVTAGPAFLQGVRRGLSDIVLSAELFSVRAGVLLGDIAREDAGDLTSGLLIGADLRVGLEGSSGDIIVMGRPELTKLYKAALGEAGRGAREFDGEQAFLAGIAAIVELIA
ncbi:2-dehydro-3-deoxygalactonokinase [Sphingomonas sp.]|uniref:2-dehydro-3-deoxygalactonokinase n=1 Tax=Sphingomonas sp. TaxID=28214 RepID=UPI00286E11EA|nr:2-dehydro-3-deoxygalactonokinase [Sphingomonas sp.]